MVAPGASMDGDKDVYKISGADPFEANVAELRKEISARNERLKGLAEKLSDPVYIAGMMLAVQNERENTNRILKNIYAELERVRALEARVSALEGSVDGEHAEAGMLPEVDEKIVEFIRAKRKACAEDVQKKFSYKGKNAASARLNRLYSLGVLNKAQAGRKVFYLVRG